MPRREAFRARFDAMSDEEKVAFLQGMQVAQGSDRVPQLADMAPAQARWFRELAARLSPPARRAPEVARRRCRPRLTRTCPPPGSS